MTARSRTVVLYAALLLACCPWKHLGPGERNLEEMEQLGSHLLYLTAAVESKAAQGMLPAEASDAERIDIATKHNPRLSKPFDKYRVLVAVEGTEAVVLVCARDADVALLEDLGCTSGRLDVKHWEARPTRPCAFTASVQEVCAATP
jgi:hypothetical protein